MSHLLRAVCALLGLQDNRLDVGLNMRKPRRRGRHPHQILHVTFVLVHQPHPHGNETEWDDGGSTFARRIPKQGEGKHYSTRPGTCIDPRHGPSGHQVRARCPITIDALHSAPRTTIRPAHPSLPLHLASIAIWPQQAHNSPWQRRTASAPPSRVLSFLAPRSPKEIEIGAEGTLEGAARVDHPLDIVTMSFADSNHAA